jgi:hypothetical protein
MNFISDAPYNTLFIIYLLISCNFLANLFSCNLQQLLSDNMYVKHIFGFFTMLFCIVYVDSNIIKESKYIEGFFYAIIFYIWFWLTTKTHLYTTIIILLLLLIVYILQIHINVRNQKLEKKQTELDQNKTKLNQEQKNIDQEQIKLNKSIDKIKLSQYIIIGFAFAITIFGFIHYYSKKRGEYGEKRTDEIEWNTLTFMLGDTKCKKNRDGSDVTKPNNRV